MHTYTLGDIRGQCSLLALLVCSPQIECVCVCVCVCVCACMQNELEECTTLA